MSYLMVGLLQVGIFLEHLDVAVVSFEELLFLGINEVLFDLGQLDLVLVLDERSRSGNNFW